MLLQGRGSKGGAKLSTEISVHTEQKFSLVPSNGTPSHVYFADVVFMHFSRCFTRLLHVCDFISDFGIKEAGYPFRRLW